MATGRHSAKAKAKAVRAGERQQVRAIAVGGQPPEPRRVTAGNFSQFSTRPLSPRATARSRAVRMPGSGPPGNRARGRSRWWSAAAVVLVVVLVAGLLAFRWVDGQVHPGGPPGKGVVVTVPVGAAAGAVADLLGARGVLSHPEVFRLYMKFRPVKSIESGPYEFHQHESYGAIEATLQAGPDTTLDDVRLTIPEGFTVSQIAERVGLMHGHTAASFLAALAAGQVQSTFRPTSGPVSGGTAAVEEAWEGLLFPDTYFVSPGETDKTLAQQMADQLEDVATSLNLDADAAALGMTPYQILTVASIVQREASNTTDMGKVARVIYNRLKQGMKLQMDSTVDYALSLQGQTQNSEITDAQENTNSPYNTYLVSGLPPGPISTPGQTALQAALHPTPGPWLYYVTIDKQGDEAFSTTLAQQNANIAAAAKNGCPNAC